MFEQCGRIPGSQEAMPSSLVLVRIALPAAIAMVGVVLILVGGDSVDDLGVLLIGVSLLVVVANALIRLSISSKADREGEQAARRRPGP